MHEMTENMWKTQRIATCGTYGDLRILEYSYFLDRQMECDKSSVKLLYAHSPLPAQKEIVGDEVSP